MKKFTRILSAFMALVLFMALIPFDNLNVSAATSNITSLPVKIKGYPISTGNNTSAYSVKGGSKSGTIYAADYCTINSIGSDGYISVTYPTSKGTRTLYVKTTSFFNSTSVQDASVTKSATAYRRSSGSATIGSVGTSDTKIWVVGSAKNGRYQIVYKVTGTSYYKLGWVTTGAVKIKTSNTSSSTTSGSGLTDVTRSFDGKKITLKSVENGKYLSADGNVSGTPARCNRTAAQTWETFTVKVTSDGWCGLKAYNGKWLSARADTTNTPVRAQADALQSWECFRIYKKGSDYYLKAQINSKWLCVRVDTSEAPLQAYAGNPSTWERFRISTVNTSSTSSIISAIDTSLVPSSSCNGNRNYVSNFIINQVNSSRGKRNLDAGKALVFFFEGAGVNQNTSNRMGALCVVVKKQNGKAKIVFETNRASTIPDHPRDTSKNGGTAVPTVVDGEYNITLKNHRQEYVALNVGCHSKGNVRRFTSVKNYSDSSYGINIHVRSTNALSPKSSKWANSTGCLTIALDNNGSASTYNSFIKAVTGISNAKSTTTSREGVDMGVVYVDRDLAVSQLKTIYGDDGIGSASANVNKILGK